MQKIINLENTRVAFATKSSIQLRKSKILFKIISNEGLVRIAKPVTNFLLRIHFPLEHILKNTVFNHFCGGETIQECKTTVNNLYNNGGVYSILDYSVEGKNEEYFFDDTLETLLRIIDFAKHSAAVPFLVFKPTGMGRPEIYERVSENAELTENELIEWQTIKKRYDIICRNTAATNALKIMIDAEESWMQKAIDELVEEMMMKYNNDRPVVFTTLQMYRWDRISYLEHLNDHGSQHGIKVGVKLVRGAYMEIERERAMLKGYESPICQDKASTDLNFNNAVSYSLKNLDVFELYIGTHNELSCQVLMKDMVEKGIQTNDNRIWFGQLYGMSDHISFNLAENGYNTSKYVPFGAVRDVIPYLLRRAEENTSIGNHTTRELSLIDKEIKRRSTKQTF